MKTVCPDVVLTEQKLGEVVDAYMGFNEFVFDVETCGPHRNRPTINRVFWLGLAGPGRCDAIPFGHPRGELLVPARKEKQPWLDHANLTKTGKPRKKQRVITIPAVYADPPKQLWPETVFSALKPLFFSEDKRKIGHNVKFDLLSVSKYFGEPPPPPYGDTIVLAHLINENRRLKLKALVESEFGVQYENIGAQVEEHPFSVAARYTLFDARYEWLLWRLYMGKIRTRAGLDAVRRLEEDVLEVLLYMELEGALIDVEAMEALSRTLSERLEAIEAKVYAEAGRVFNLDSNPEKAKFIYEVRGHEPTVWTGKKKQPSTAKGVLAQYAKKDRVVADLLDYAKVKKLLSTYVGEQDPETGEWGGLRGLLLDGRLHADFVQYGTKTGRFSCREPNLQNIPRRGEQAALIRAMFIAPPGHVLVVADYSQIEMRVLAHFSREPSLIRAFEQGIDPHAATAATLFDVPVEEVTDKQRDGGKTINFAAIYGAGPNKIAAQAGVSLARAKEFLYLQGKTQPRVRAWREHTIAQCRRRKPPYVETILGRRRRLPAINSQDTDARAGAERQAVNTRIQGSAGDIIKIAMVRLHRMLPPSMPLILTVHDELVVVAPESESAQAAALMSEAMEGVRLLCVPLIAEAKVGRNWSEAKA